MKTISLRMRIRIRMMVKMRMMMMMIRFDSIGQRARPAGMSLDEFARKQRRGGQCAAERDIRKDGTA